MKIPSLIVRTGVKWETFAGTLDDWINAVQTVLSGAWSITDQASGELKTIAWNSSDSPLKVSTRLTSRPLSVLALCSQLPNTTAFSSGSFVEWSWDGKDLSIKTISGLALNTDYSVTLWMVGA